MNKSTNISNVSSQSVPAGGEFQNAIQRLEGANNILSTQEFHARVNMRALQRRREAVQASFRRKLAVGMMAVAMVGGVGAVLAEAGASADNQNAQIGQLSSEGIAHGQAVRDNSIAAQEGLSPENTGVGADGQIVAVQP